MKLATKQARAALVSCANVLLTDIPNEYPLNYIY